MRLLKQLQCIALLETNMNQCLIGNMKNIFYGLNEIFVDILIKMKTRETNQNSL